MTNSNRTIWLRLGVTFTGSKEDIESIIKEDKDTLLRLLESGTYKADGESYIPESEIQEYNEKHGTNFEEDEVFFELNSSKKIETTTKSYKAEFLKWAEENNIELFQNLSDVLPDSPYNLKVGQTCTFRNYCFCDFPGYTIMGFCKPTLSGSCVYLDCDSYWCPKQPEMILLDGTKDQQCDIETTQDNDGNIILNINRIRCLLQSYETGIFANLIPFQNGLETLEEELGNIHIDFVENTFSSDGYNSVKWHNFTHTIDIAEVKNVIDQIGLSGNQAVGCIVGIGNSKNIELKNTMEITDVLDRIKENVKKNNGEWDLTNEDGEPIVYCFEKNLHIPDLAVNKDGEVCALVPLGYFAEETLLNILEIM